MEIDRRLAVKIQWFPKWNISCYSFVCLRASAIKIILLTTLFFNILSTIHFFIDLNHVEFHTLRMDSVKSGGLYIDFNQLIRE